MFPFLTVHHLVCFPFFCSHDMITYVMLFGIYVSADDVYSGEMLYTAKNLFEEDSNTIWIAALDNHMYHDLSSNTIENTMIPQDYTGIIR